MDNNNNTNQNQPAPETPAVPTPAIETPAPAQPVQPQIPTPSTPPTAEPTQTPPATSEHTNMPTQHASGGNKVIIAVGVLLIVGVMTAAGFFLFTSYNSQNATPATTEVQTQSAPVETLTPTPSSPSSELDNIQIDDPTSDLNSINQDVNQL